jgi:hypothetical protein
MCRLCTELGMTPIRPATDVDHRKPVAAGGATFDPTNLQSLCAEHHSWKTGTYDMQGKPWDEWEQRGCFSDGSPRDPSHPWYSGPPPGEDPEGRCITVG